MIFFAFLVFLFSSDLNASQKSVYELIENNQDLSIFKNYIDNTGLDDVLKKKIPYFTTAAGCNAAALAIDVKINKEMAVYKIQDLIKLAEEELIKTEINDQTKYLVDQKIEALRSLN